MYDQHEEPTDRSNGHTATTRWFVKLVDDVVSGVEGTRAGGMHKGQVEAEEGFPASA